MQTNFRRALSDCEVNGFKVHRRDNIVLVLGAANRDPDIFEDQDRLDIGRGEGVHLSFGKRPGNGVIDRRGEGLLGVEFRPGRWV